MKKTLFSALIILSIVLGFETKVSSQSKFQVDYYSNFSAMDMDLFAGVKKATSGFAIAGTAVGFSLPLQSGILIATDTMGTVTWAKRIKDNNFIPTKDAYINDLQTTSAGGFIMTGSYNDNAALLLKVDGSGTHVFSASYGSSPNEFGNAVKELSGSTGYLVAGETSGKSMNPDKDSTSIYVFKTDNGGAYQWGRSYTIPSAPVFDSHDAAMDVVEVPTGYVFAGYHSQKNGVDTTTNILVFKTDASGTLQWMKSYGDIGYNEEAYSIKLLSNGDLLVGGYTDKVGIGSSICVLELNAANGNLVSSSAYGVGGLADMLGSIQQTSTGFAIVGWTVGLNYKSFLLTLNSSYVPVAAKTYNTFIGGLFTKGEQVPGGYIIGSMIGVTSYQLHMIKTDASGSSGSGCTEANVTPVQYSYTPSVTDFTATVSVKTGGSRKSTSVVALSNVTPTSTVECITLPLVANAGNDQTICSGGSATIGGAPTANYGTTPYTYSWSSSPAGFTSTAANPVVSPTVNTTYTVTIFDNAGATMTDAVTVNVNALPTVTATNNGPVCAGGNVNLTGGTNGMISYTWAGPSSFSSTSQNPIVSPAVAGTYTLTVSNGTCTNTASTTVVVNALPAASALNNGPVCVGSALTLTGGANGLTYNWSGPSFSSTSQSPTVSASATPAMAGTYTLTVSNGTCTNTATTVVTVNILPTVTTSNNGPVCYANSLDLTGLPNGMSSYNWSGPNGFSSSSQNPNVSPNATSLMAGTYTLTVSDGVCTNTSSTVVIVNVLPTPDLGSDVGTCIGQGIMITAHGGGSYSWSPTTDLSCTTCANPIASPSGTTTYIVTVTDGNGCSASEDIVVNIYSAPPADAGIGTGICLGSSATLTATGAGVGGTYAWSTTETSASINVSPAITTTYTVTVTDVAGCSATDDVTVLVNLLPTATASNSGPVCFGSSLDLTSGLNGMSSYSWSGPDGFTSFSQNPNVSGNVTPLMAGVYTVTVFDGVCSNTATTNVVINTLPNPNLGSDVGVCSGYGVTLTASGGGTYAWSPTTDLSCINCANPTASPSDTTTYTVTVTDANGCSNTDDIIVFVYNIPVASAGMDDSICIGSSTNLSATGGSTYAWNTGAGTQSITVSPGTTTIYTVTVFDVSGCSATDDVLITVNTLPNANAGNNVTICPGGSTTLNASGGTSYVWSPSATLSDANIFNPVASPTSNTTYIVTVTDGNGCSKTDDVTVTVNIPTANAGSNATICQGNSTVLNANGGTSYAWSPGSGLSSSTVANPTANPATTTNYVVTVTNAAGCTATDDVTVTVNPLPSANAGIDATICFGNSTNLSATGGSTYSWSPGTGLSSTGISNPVASPDITMVYTVTVTDANGCSDSDDVTVNVNATPVANAGIDQSVCLGESASLTATGGGSYDWNTGDTTAIVNYTPSVTTTYVVTVSYTNGCSSSDEVTVTVNSIPSVTITSDPDDFAYTGQVVTFTALPDGYDVYNFYVDGTLVQTGSSNVYQTNSLTDGQVVSSSVTNLSCESVADTMAYEIKPIPNAFTPYDLNGKNDIFVRGLDVTIFNRWGQTLYQGSEGWDGKYDGKLVSPGTYYYIISIKDLKNQINEIHGSVTLVDNQ